MSLPVVPHNADSRTFSVALNRLVREFNRPDLFVPSYAVDTGSATAYAITPSSDIKVYQVGQIFVFTAANANTATAPTLNVQGLGAGAITYPDGSALGIGDIPAAGNVAVIVASTTPTFHLLSASRNKLLQMVSTETSGVATGTTTVPVDDTIPQSNEGDQYMSLAIAPKSATSKLVITATAVVASSAATEHMVMALFQDSTASALSSTLQILNGTAGGQATVLTLTHVMTSGTTSSTTFKIRIGAGAASTTTFNGLLASRILGGSLASSIKIEEVLP